MEVCRNGNHTLIEIKRYYIMGSCEEEEVVRWCEFCGAIVIDLEIDNRTFPGHVREMSFPQLMYLKKKENVPT